MNVLITGGASGLGLAVTQALAVQCDRVYFTYCRSVEAARSLEEQHSNCKAYHCDFADADSVASLVEQVPALGLSALVNNALSSIVQVQFQKYDLDDVKESFERNVVPVLRITQAAIEQFRKRKQGNIITVLSAYLDEYPVGHAEYVANKAYLGAMCKAWAAENEKYHIMSNAISPTIMRTGLTASTDERVLEILARRHSSGQLLSPKTVAQKVAQLLLASHVTTSQNYRWVDSQQDFVGMPL